jgi:hypothetical protein
MRLHANTMNAIDLRPYLLGCGYHRSRLAFDVEFDSPHPIPLVAFAHSPHDSRSACVAVLDEVANPEVDVAACRGVGAPLVFAPFNDQWQLWKQGTDKPQLIESVPPSELTNFFVDRTDLSPDSVYRAKTWARFDSNYQLNFVDLGLMPLVEEQAGRKLSGLIERVVTDTRARLGWQEISNEQGHWLWKSSFWLLAGKILRDKRVPAFEGLELEDLEDVFERVATHYGAIKRVSPGPSVQADALREAAIQISRFSNLGLVTIEALAYLYENALITKATRTELGTHSTPSYLVDYIVGKLRPWIQEIPANERQAFEPACGHAAFLLAGMRLLSELLSPETSPSSRRSYLRARLHGWDVDAFALEIARLSLTLSDVPNPNGWDLQHADMFGGDVLDRASAKANIILANPPFKRAAEMLTRVVSNMRPGAVLGVVLPQGLLHSRNARQLRETIASKFEIAEICLFPDNVFSFSDAESAVLLARCVKTGEQSRQTIAYRHVRERGVERFKRSYHVTNEYKIQSSQFSADNNWDFLVPDLQDVWKFCANLPKFDDVAVIGKGFDFRSEDDPNFPPGAITVSNEEREGFVSGFVKLHPTLQTHELPRAVWVNLDAAVVKTPRYGTDRGIQQLLLNYGRVSRGPWRLKALLDIEGHAVSSRFLVVRPRDSQWPLEALWGICNSPFANAYSYAFSSKRDILSGLMRKMPIPDGRSELMPLVNAVRAYRASVLGEENSVLSSQRSSNELRLLHWQIDVEVLRLYELPARLEREVLNLFSGFERRGVPFSQTAYFPRGFSESMRLRDLLAVATTGDWDQLNERRTDLILKGVEGTISATEQSELDDLQRLADARIFLQAPLPITQMERIKEDLQKRGIWEASDATT